jgi:hypothetical protein
MKETIVTRNMLTGTSGERLVGRKIVTREGNRAYLDDVVQHYGKISAVSDEMVYIQYDTDGVRVSDMLYDDDWCIEGFKLTAAQEECSYQRLYLIDEDEECAGVPAAEELFMIVDMVGAAVLRLNLRREDLEQSIAALIDNNCPVGNIRVVSYNDLQPVSVSIKIG